MTTPSFQLLKVDHSVTLDSLSTLNLSKNLIGYKEAIKKTLYPESSPLPCHFHSYYPDPGSWITLAGLPYQPPEGSLCSCPSLLEGHRDPLRHQSHHHAPLPRLCSDHLLLYNDSHKNRSPHNELASCFSSLLNLLQSQWPPTSSLNISGTFIPLASHWCFSFRILSPQVATQCPHLLQVCSAWRPTQNACLKLHPPSLWSSNPLFPTTHIVPSLKCLPLKIYLFVYFLFIQTHLHAHTPGI